MEFLKSIFDIHSTLFNFPGYPMSYLEFIGTLAGLISVYYATKANILTWSTGILNELAFFALFFQVQLYSDMLLQAFFLLISIQGWINWKTNQGTGKYQIAFLTKKKLILVFIGIILSSILVGIIMTNIHQYCPLIFHKPAAFPFTDAFVAILSIVATLLMIYKKVECWYLWILVDLISIAMYFFKNLFVVSGEYIIFLLLAIYGLLNWIKQYKHENRFGIREIHANS